MLAKDTHAAIVWLVEHASELDIDPERIAIMGDSGGGGVAAGAAILARDNGTTSIRVLRTDLSYLHHLQRLLNGLQRIA